MADPAVTVRQNENLARRDDLYRLPNNVESMSLDEVQFSWEFEEEA